MENKKGKDQDELTAEEISKLADTPEKRTALIDLALCSLSRLDSPRGFKAFFHFMHGIPLHSEGEKWTDNIFHAHEVGLGDLQECHREAGKTTFSKFFVAWRIGMEPQKKNAIIRVNDDKAIETAAAVASIIKDDPKWKMCFPNVVPDQDRGWGDKKGYYVKRIDVTDDAWARTLTQSPDGATLIGHGWTSGSILGSRWNGVVDVDDIHNRENTASERQLSDVRGFYRDTFQYCVMKGAWEIWNYTPWLSNDLYAYLASTGMYIHNKTPVMLPAKEGEEGAEYWEKDPMIPLSGRWWKLYWKEVWNFDRIAEKYKKTGAVDFAKEMMLDLEATKGLDLKTEWLHEYPLKDIGASYPVVFGIDYASTADKMKDKDRDYFAMAVLRAIPGGGLVLVDGYRGHISKGEGLNLVISYWGIYPTLQKIGVESIGSGKEFYNDLIFMQDVNGRVPPLMAIPHHATSKGKRFEEWLAPRFQMSRIWVADTPSPFVQEFKNEWMLYPNSTHDDCLDAVYMAAFVAEGYMPSRAERTFDKKKNDNPLKVLFDYSYYGQKNIDHYGRDKQHAQRT